MSEKQTLLHTIDGVKAQAQDDSVSVGELTDALGKQGMLPLVLFPALVAATPLSGIPGLSAFCGILIALFSFELIFGFRNAYLPSRLRRQTIDGSKLRTAIDKLRPPLGWLDRHTHDRLDFLFHRPVIWVPQIMCLLTGLMMPFLEFIPFSSSIAAIGVCFLVLAMLTRDGVFFAVALLPYVGMIYLVVRVIA